jgi:hypothetical protein
MSTSTTLAPTRPAEAPAAPLRSRIERWAPIGGIAFVVLMVVGSMLVSDVPAPDASGQEIAGYLADSDRQIRNIVGAYLWVVGALAFIWFLVRLRNDLRRAEGGTGALSNMVLVAGGAFAAVWTVSAATFAGVANAASLRDAPVSNPDFVRVLPTLGRFILLLGGGFTGLLVVLLASIVIFRTGVFPRWLAVLGVVAAVTLLFDIVYLTIFPFWTWVFIASVVTLVRPDGRQSASVAADQQPRAASIA